MDIKEENMNNPITTVILNDFESGKRIVTTIDTSDLDHVKTVWNNKDKILVDMQEHPVFAGKEHWCDLDPKHYTMMMMSMLNASSKLSVEDRIDNSNRIIASLHFLYAALILSLQIKTDSLVELIRINRMSDDDITYDFTATFNIFEGNDVYKRKDDTISGLRVVVDNEDEEDDE